MVIGLGQFGALVIRYVYTLHLTDIDIDIDISVGRYVCTDGNVVRSFMDADILFILHARLPIRQAHLWLVVGYLGAGLHAPSSPIHPSH